MRAKKLLFGMLVLQLSLSVIILTSPSAFSFEGPGEHGPPCYCATGECEGAVKCDADLCWIYSYGICLFTYPLGYCECCVIEEYPPRCETELWLVECDNGECGIH